MDVYEKTPMLISAYRTYYLVNCVLCNKSMKVRNDYIHKHSGICMSCQGIGNKQALRHGDYKKRLYKIWSSLGHRNYKNITPMVCEEWKDYKTFRMWALNNGYKRNLTIDRIDNTGNYEPSNCQWITLQENAGKDKIIFSKIEKLCIYKLRKLFNLTQRETAKTLSVSRNTIQRAEKCAKEML